MADFMNIEVLLPEIRAYARSICLSAIEAEDLVQDAVERALRSDTRPADLADLRPWMFRVVRNLFYDELRKHRVRREYSTDQIRLSNDGYGVPNPENDILLRLAYEKLSPEFKEILFLVDVMGLKYVEAARVIDAPKGTVMSRVSRARKALLELVGRDDSKAAAMKRT
ncbi:MAG: RNA polymerase sigma factor [Pseudomonadota bacterium]